MSSQERDTLPEHVKPTHYDLSLYDIEHGGTFAYKGTVAIDLKIAKPTKEITLNTEQVKILSVELKTEHTKTEQAFTASNISYDTNSQRATLSFDEEVPATQKGSLVIKFQGTVNNSMTGFYRSRYKPTGDVPKSVARDDEYHYMYSTQFESCEARKAFPCFDEPNLKATFDVTLEVPEELVALSNMPEKEVKKGDKQGTKIVTFDRTPIMSTYLLAWAIGDFEYVEDFTKRKYNGKSVPVRVYTTRGLKEQGRFALENAHQIVDYYSEIFDIDYPLPKADLLAVHEFSHGAMENWGLVTYRTTAVLFDEEKSDQRYRHRVAYVVAHELAHQWFGNLVTMDWWNELWLNEGFATWVGFVAVDHLYPDWDQWAQFCTDSVQSAFQLDGLRTSHPIDVPVRNALEIDQVFDHISYRKGSSVIRMLSAHLGKETFLKGVSDYLKAHAYGNARTVDLWSAIGKAAGQDVNKFMDAWILKIGFPVVTVAEEPGQITLKQNRFLLSGDVKPEEDETLWWIPLGLKTGPEAKIHSVTVLSQREDTIREVDDSFYKLNADTTGVYRVNYPPERLAKLGAAKAQLSNEDKIGLVADAAALAISGQGTTAAFLALVENFGDESNYLVWAQIISNLATIRNVFGDYEDVSKGIRAFTNKLTSPAAEKVGWEFKKDEGYLTGQLRALLLAQAGNTGHEGILQEAQRQFTAYTKDGDKSAIHPSLRSAVFRMVVGAVGEPAYRAVKNEYLTTSSIDGKEICLQSLGSTKSPELARELMDFLFSPEVATQDVHTGAISLASNIKSREIVWSYIKENWTSKVKPSLGDRMVVLERFLQYGLNKYASFEVQKDIDDFFAKEDCKGFDRGLSVARDTVKGNATYKERDVDGVREWLGAHGYL